MAAASIAESAALPRRAAPRAPRRPLSDVLLGTG
jgi:hypothetical protein